MGYQRRFAAALQVGSLLLALASLPAQFPSRIDLDSFDRRLTDVSKTGKAVDVPAPVPTPIYRLGESLTSPQAADPEAIGRDYLLLLDQAGNTKSASNTEWRTAARYETLRAGVTHLVFERTHAGVRYFDSHASVHVGSDGRIWRVTPAPPAPRPGYLTTTATQEHAVQVAIAALAPRVTPHLTTIIPEHGPDRSAVLSDPSLLSEVPVRLVWFPFPELAIPAWEMFLDLSGQGAYWMVVDANTREILFSRNLLRTAEPWGKVFRAPDRPNPPAGPQTEEPLSGWPPAGGLCPASIYPGQSRIGELAGRCWTSSGETTGNNVDACRDLDGNNLCDAHAAADGDAFDFLFTDSYALTGNPAPDRDAALTNAFYWANVAHDHFYTLGFDEPAGNFQTDNFGLGGAAADAVRLDIEDSSSTNSATFVTPPDGISPRMQLGLFIWNQRDSAFDADLILHEYAHGLTARLVGGPNDVISLFLWQSGALSEGWSDAYATSFVDDPVFGEYVTGNPTSGLRTFAYDDSPLTFGDLGTLYLKVVPGTGRLLRLPQVHHDGEVWTAVLWDLRSTLGQANFEQIVTTGLKLTPSRPSMLDARDAILQAAQLHSVGGANGCPLWAAFATRGFGFSAALNPVEPGQFNDAALSVYESFDLPANCGGEPPVTGATLLFEDAESGGVDWESTGLWHVSPRRSAGGTHSWWYGQESTADYDTGDRSFGTLTSPPIDLTASTGALIEWNQYFAGEGFGSAINLGTNTGAYLNADSGRLMVSTDNGISWRTISHFAHNSTSGDFEPHKVNLTAYVGQSIRLRFDFDTFDADANNHEGWFLDNIRVSQLGSNSPPVTTIAEWTFDEPGSGSGIAISDTSGGGHHGVTQSFGSIAVPGVDGNARLLNGAADSIDFGSAAALTPADFTIRTWVQLRSYPASLGMILSAYGGNHRGWWLGVNAQGTLHFLTARAPSSAGWLSAPFPLDLERWHHVTVTYDHLMRQASLYVDGVLQSQAVVTGLDPETALPMLAGKASWFPGYHLDFAIDETRIDSGVRTSAEIAADFETFTPPPAVANPSVTAHWSFDGAAEDDSGNQHHGVPQNPASVPGVSGDALEFDGFNDSVTIPWSPRLTPTQFSLRSWIKLSSYPGNLGVVFANYGGNYQGWFLAARSDGRLVLSVSRLPAVSRGLLSASVLELDRWYHVTATYDGRTQQARLFLDGFLDAQSYAAGLTPRAGGSATIGAASWYTGSFLAFSIDDLQLLPKVLSPTEVLQDFTSFPDPEPAVPLAVWNFDDPSNGPGTILSDSSGRDHHAVTAGSGAPMVEGAAGSARRFNGFSDYATLTPHADLSTTDFSFTTWIKLEEHPLSWGVIFSNYGGDYQGWFCGINAGGNLLLSIAGLPTHSGWLVSNQSFETGRWYHIAVTFKNSARRAVIYIDGLQDRTAVFNAFTPQTGVQPTFGRASWYNGAYLQMTLDSARLYSGELSPLDVVADRDSL